MYYAEGNYESERESIEVHFDVIVGGCHWPFILVQGRIHWVLRGYGISGDA